MPTSPYVPEIGDVVSLEFDPQSGHEQAGHRPALVLTPSSYNARSGLMVCCPLTTRIKGYPFEVSATIDEQAGVVLSDQVKSLDWRAHKARKKGSVSAEIMRDVRARIKTLLTIT